MKSKYIPEPIEIESVKLSESLLELVEKLSKHNHDLWASQRFKENWKFGKERNDNRKSHPCLIPYEYLPDCEKEYDRISVIGTLKAIIKLGYSITEI